MVSRRGLRPIARALLFFLLVALSTKRAVSSWNDAARMGTIQSLVEERTLAIDGSNFVEITSDVYRYQGKTYSSKPPLLAVMVAPIYAGLRPLGITFDRHPAWTYYLLTLLSVGLASAIGVGLLWHLWVNVLGRSARWADVAALLAGAGTLTLPFATVFNSHAVCAVLILAGLYFSLRHGGQRPSAAIWSGVSLSLAAAFDPSLLVFLPAGLWLIGRRGRRAALVFLLASAPLLLLAVGLNLQTSGSPLPPTLNAPLRDYPGSEFREQPLSGLAGHDDLGDLVVYGYHSLLGNRGLFSHSPILLLAVVGTFALARQEPSLQHKRVLLIFGVACLLYFGLYLFRTSNYSGEAFGIRWFVSLMPILAFPLGYLEARVRDSKGLRVAFLLVAFASIGLSVLGSYRPFLPVADFIPGQPGVVDNTIVVAFDRFVRLASTGGQLRTLTLGLLATGMFLVAFRRWRAGAPTGATSP